MTRTKLTKGEDYRASHAVPDAGRIYNHTYEEGYYAAVWDKIERPLVETTLRKLGGSEKSCLDFACGTGRITDVAAECFGSVVGVDVSASMLSHARGARNVRLHNVDLTRRSLGRTFDVATAFRFFLNADQRLRMEALRAIRAHLKDGGALVCNVQMNATSPTGLACRIVDRLPWSLQRNTMSIDQMSALLASAGFTIEEVIPYGFLPRPGNLLPKFCEAMVGPIERLALAMKLPARFALLFFIIARKAADLPA